MKMSVCKVTHMYVSMYVHMYTYSNVQIIVFGNLTNIGNETYEQSGGYDDRQRKPIDS